jgi:toxin ParE1/3/4
MGFEIVISQRAQREIENAIQFYQMLSLNVPNHFISFLNDVYRSLEKNPFFAVRYKNVRAIKIRRFPYALFFTIDESKNRVRVLSCFHTKRNPQKRPEF